MFVNRLHMTKRPGLIRKKTKNTAYRFPRPRGRVLERFSGGNSADLTLTTSAGSAWFWSWDLASELCLVFGRLERRVFRFFSGTFWGGGRAAPMLRPLFFWGGNEQD